MAKTVKLFGSKDEVDNIPPPDQSKALRMLKVVEERISNLDKKTELIENNIIAINKRQGVENKTIHIKLLELEKDVTLIKRRITEMAADLKNFARREDLDTIKKYLNVWEPLHFVTRDEIDEIIDEKIRKV